MKVASKRYLTNASFCKEAAARFSFLDDRDFIGPEKGEYRLAYSSGSLTVEILYDDRDGRVLTLISGYIGGRNPRASLPCLYRSAGLGPAQDIREIARSPKILGPVLDSHASALGKILPILEGASGRELLLSCHGR